MENVPNRTQRTEKNWNENDVSRSERQSKQSQIRRSQEQPDHEEEEK